MGAKAFASKYLTPTARNRIARRYFGKTAEQYEARRQGKRKWQAEDAAVAELIQGISGAVIDCPVGTGRFLPLYERLGLDALGVDISPDMIAVARQKGYGSLQTGSAFDLSDKADVLVCVRFLGHLEPHELRQVLGVFRRCAPVIICGMRFGGKAVPGKRVPYSREFFEDAMQPYRVVRRIKLDDADYWMNRCEA